MRDEQFASNGTLDEVEMVAIEKAVTVAGLEPRPTATARHAKKAILATGLRTFMNKMYQQER